MATDNYTNDSIESLSDEIEAIRNKPSSIGIENHNHLFTEVLANSIDEAREGYGNLIEITKYKDLRITVSDKGRGIPLGKNSSGEYVYKVNLCKLWTGGKMRNNINNVGYLYSLGTNGCGLKATNFTSDIFQCTSYRDNKKYFIEYHKGRQFTDLQEEDYTYNHTGTIITWKPSADVYRTGDDTDEEFIDIMLQQQAIVNGGLKFTFKDEINDTYKEYYYERGAIDFIQEYCNNNNFTDIIHWSTEAEGKDKTKKKQENKKNEPYKIKCNVIFTFNNEKQLLDCYHNGSYLANGGTPEKFIQNAFTYAINQYVTSNNLYTKSDNKIKFEDISDSLVIISDTYSTISLYSDQAKKKIDSELMQRHMTQYLKEQLELYFLENKIEADKIVNQILVNMRARTKAEKTKLNVKAVLQQSNKKGLSLKIEGLKDCDMRNSTLEERILLVDEGVSPNSTIIKSFEGRTMGAMGLRGRFINALKSSVADVLKNVPAHTLITALGCGIEIPYEERKIFKDIQTFNLDNLRYGSVGILCDADAFGKGINLALITFFYKFIPTLLKQGRIFLVKSPRFCITTKKEVFYAYDENEKKTIIEKLQSQNTKYDIGIKKGLGEFNTDEFWEYVLSPEAREKTFIQLNYNKVEEEIIKYYFDALMGENITERKKYIKENITNVNLNELN